MADGSSRSRERRVHERAPLQLSIMLTLAGARMPAELSDLSEGGLLLLSPIAPAIRSRAKLSFRVAPNIHCAAEGTVVRRDGGGGFGVEFTSMNDEMRQLIGDLLAMREALRASFLGSILDPVIEFV